jgi:hypothetical protein
MSEAKDDSTQKRKAVTLSVAEIHSLADRLASRAQSVLLRDEPEQARDLLSASRVIRVLTRRVNHSDVLTIENGN